MNTIPELIEEIRLGKMVLLVDDEDRENEGDLVMAAEFVTPESVNFMAKEARGLICLSLTEAQVDRLRLPPMVSDAENHSPNKTAFLVSIEARTGVSTGISAHDRAHTIQVAANPGSDHQSVSMPGHVFPIRAQKGGVLKRPGHTEGSVDLARLAGLNPAAVICEVMNEDGTMARLPDLKEFAKKFDLKIGTIADLIQYRLQTETLIEEIEVAPQRAKIGELFQVRVFRSLIDRAEHVALILGDPARAAEPPLVRVQTSRGIGDFLSSFFHSEGRVSRAAEKMRAHGCGVILLLQTLPSETKDAMDPRDYGIGAQILRALGLTRIQILSQLEPRLAALRGYNLEITDTVEF